VEGAGKSVEIETAARRVAAALESEPGAVVLRPSPYARALVARLPVGVARVAVLPDMPQLLRDAAERGAARAVLGRAAAGGAAAWPRLVRTALGHLADLARQDFRGIVPLLIELDRAGLGTAALHGVAVAAPLTDLLLAAGHRHCLAHVVEYLRRRVGAAAGFETLNLGHLLPRLAAWEIAADFVIGPLNPCGFRMKPSPPEVRAAVRESRIAVLASEVSARGTVAVHEGIEHARAHGAAGVVLALDEIGEDRRGGPP
jgi:hypothetical protein